MTLSQAASVLGISASASKAEVNSAYRAAVSKYHPDANRGKSPEEQKRAEQMFKQVGMARKVMLNPQIADPEPSSPTDAGYSPSTESRHAQKPQSGTHPFQTGASSTPTSGAGNHRTSPRVSQSYKASSSSSRYVSQGYNTSHSFHDDVEKSVDPAEDEIARIYRDESRKEYLRFSDKARLTPSAGASLLFLAVAGAMFFASPLSLGSLSLANPCLLLAAIALFKMATYDLFASYYVKRAISKRFSKAWGVLFGAETAVLAAIGIALFATMSGMLDCPFAMPAMVVLVFIGIAIAAVSVSLSKKKNPAKTR